MLLFFVHFKAEILWQLFIMHAALVTNKKKHLELFPQCLTLVIRIEKK